jgi:hypothetical protein
MNRFLILVLLIFFLLPGQAQESDSFEAVTPEMDKSIERSLAWLAKNQNKEGFFDCAIGNRVGYSYHEHSFGSHVGVTAIAGMAFLANGHVPGVGTYGELMKKIVGAMIHSSQGNGYATLNGSRMYSHAFATLFMAEVYGMTGDPKLKKALKTAVKLIIQHQNKAGGWRYNPDADDADLSVVVCLVQALRAANNAGIHVPRGVIDHSLKYIRSLAYKREDSVKANNQAFQRRYIDHRRYEGGFYYQNMGRDGMTERVTFAICAAGVTALHGSGIYEGRELDGGYAFLKKRYLDNRFPDRIAYEGYAINRRGVVNRHARGLRPHEQSFQFFYGHYYAVQAFHQKGGRDWRRWFTKIRKDILSIQYADGHYKDEVGENYATAMATLILSIPKGYLPIFQR